MPEDFNSQETQQVPRWSSPETGRYSKGLSHQQ